MDPVPTFEQGDKVKIVDTFQFSGAGERVICRGVVERLTKAWIWVKNEHGNVTKFRTKDAKCEGYSWPHLTSSLRKDA